MARHKLPKWGRRKVNDRAFLKKTLEPVRRKILLPKFKAISELDKKLAEKHNTWCHGYEVQRYVDFSNIKDDFRTVINSIFGKDQISRIFFPAVYVGRVAKEISDAGFEVICSDIQQVWVENAKKMGLKAFLGSAEEFPEREIDLVVSFEPYPLRYRPTGYITLLKIMAETKGFVDIDYHPVSSELIFTKIPKHALQELVFWGIPREYGCFEKKAVHDLIYSVSITSEEARNHAKLDLAVIGILERGGRISVRDISEALAKDVIEIDDSIARIVRAIYEAYGYCFTEDIYTDFKAGKRVWSSAEIIEGITGIREVDGNFGDVKISDVMHEIEITD